MKAMKCDRCKKYYDAGIAVYSEKGLPFEHITLIGVHMGTTLDLCPDCRKSFNLWLKEGATNELQ